MVVRNREIVPPYSLKWADFKLSMYQENWLLSIAVPSWINSSGKSAAQIWFETFIDYVDKLGYTIIKKGIPAATPRVDNLVLKVKIVRALTGKGLLDCRNALMACDGKVELAVKYFKVKENLSV